MPEGKNYKSIDSGFQILVILMDRYSVRVEETLLTIACVLYSELVDSMMENGRQRK